MASLNDIDVNKICTVQVKLVGLRKFNIKTKLIIFMLKRLGCDVIAEVSAVECRD